MSQDGPKINFGSDVNNLQHIFKNVNLELNYFNLGLGFSLSISVGNTKSAIN